MNTVLIIDDNPHDIRILNSALTGKNFHIVFSLNGYEGFNQACIAQPDLILLDWMMPEVDGLKVCRLFKSDSRTAHIPIIFLTSMESAEDKVEAFQHGACDYIIKPCNHDELVMRIRTHIGLHRSYHEHEKEIVESPTVSPFDVEGISRAELRVRKAQSLYLQDLTVNLSVSEVAKKIGTHARQLSNDFNSITGKHISHWLQEKRMEQACHFLLKTDFDIGRVAEHVGYTSVTTFTNTFRDYFGMSPKEYRRLIGLKSDN